MTFILPNRMEEQFEEVGLDLDAVEDRALRRAGAGFREEIDINLVEFSDRQLGWLCWLILITDPRWYDPDLSDTLLSDSGDQRGVNG